MLVKLTLSEGDPNGASGANCCHMVLCGLILEFFEANAKVWMVTCCQMLATGAMPCHVCGVWADSECSTGEAELFTSDHVRTGSDCAVIAPTLLFTDQQLDLGKVPWPVSDGTFNFYGNELYFCTFFHFESS